MHKGLDMKYTLSIHGVPQGSQVCGDISDYEYIKSFYNSVSAASVPTQMLVDIRNCEGKICTYYHYLILSNVSDSQSRSGSYFGISICFEGVYCIDFVGLYNLFDACFKKAVLNYVLTQTGQNLKYIISKFNTAEIGIQKINGFIRKNIGQFERDLAPFPLDFSPKHRNDNLIEKWSTEDVGCRTFINVLLRDSMASISPAYPIMSKKVEILQNEGYGKDGQIQALELEKSKLEGEVVALTSTISKKEQELHSHNEIIHQQQGVIVDREGEIDSLNADNAKLKNEITCLQAQVKTLEDTLEQARDNKDIEILNQCLKSLDSIVATRTLINKQISDVAPKLKQIKDHIELIYSQQNRRNHSFLGRTLKRYIYDVIVIVVVSTIVGGVFLLFTNRNTTDTLSESDVKTMLSEGISPIITRLDELEIKIPNQQHTIADDSEQDNKTVEQETIHHYTVKPPSNYRSSPNSTDQNNKLGTFNNEDTIEVISIEGNWAKFKYQDGVAYIHVDRITLIE